MRHDYTREELRAIHDLPLPQLLQRAISIHLETFGDHDVQMCRLLSVKTGGCKEDCGYCPQSAHHDVTLDQTGMLDLTAIRAAAQAARTEGATRFCMGAAWRSPPERGSQFETFLQAIRDVSAMGLEVCVTLGMLNDEQARALRAAGVHAYNHNLDTSPEFYSEIITTRTYQDRLDTLARARAAGMTLCSGGIIGMGESVDDRMGLLEELCRLDPHPESVPINLLVPVPGTPLAATATPVPPLDLVRMIATARIVMPYSRVRLSAGRLNLSAEAQALCFVAGANSVFTGEKLLTTGNPDTQADLELIASIGLRPAALATAAQPAGRC